MLVTSDRDRISTLTCERERERAPERGFLSSSRSATRSQSRCSERQRWVVDTPRLLIQRISRSTNTIDYVDNDSIRSRPENATHYRTRNTSNATMIISPPRRLNSRLLRRRSTVAIVGFRSCPSSILSLSLLNGLHARDSGLFSRWNVPCFHSRCINSALVF